MLDPRVTAERVPNTAEPPPRVRPAIYTHSHRRLLAGLVWAVTYYLAGNKISWMAGMGAYNFLIAFALAVVGLLMTVWWR